MALQAQQIHLNNAQEPRVGGGVWSVTTAAALRLDRNMFIDERSQFVRVTLVTDGIAARQSLDLAQGGSAMDVVTITTTNESFVDSMPIGFCEICFRRSVTSVAKIRLCPRQQVLRLLGVMGRVTVQAADVITAVYRSGEMPLAVAFTVAAQATARDLLP
jgi:hypothetical protein